MSTRQLNSQAKHSDWGEGWSVGLRVWVERAGQAILGKGRLELLEGIDRHHSISAAARQMGMSYRRAWELVQHINAAAGEPLVIAVTGGSHGGGAELTALGRHALGLFGELQRRLHETAAGVLSHLLEQPSTTCLHIAAAVSLEEVLGQLLTDFALRQPTVRVRAVYGASDELVNQLLARARAEVILSADPAQLDRLEDAQLLTPGSRRVVAENSLAAVAPAHRAVTVRKPADLGQAGRTRFVLASPPCPLGVYTRAYLEQLGLYEALRARATLVENSRAVLSALRADQADVGLMYGSDAFRAEGCRLLFRVGRLPHPIQYMAAMLSHCEQPEQARLLLDFLVSREAARRFRGCGFMVPAAPPR
jgi:molybdenum ABC transporter molybdate-binding protein